MTDMPADDDYDLKTLLELRNKQRDEAEERYARAMAVHQKWGKKVQRLERKHGEMIRQRQRKCQSFDEGLVEGPATMAEIQAFDRHIIGLRGREERLWSDVEAAREKKTGARKKMEQKRQAMLEAIRQVKAIEKHYEKWKKEQEITNKRRQAAKMDDVAARMWRQNR